MQQATRPLELNFRLTLMRIRSTQLFNCLASGPKAIRVAGSKASIIAERAFRRAKTPGGPWTPDGYERSCKASQGLCTYRLKKEHDGEMPKAIRIGKAVQWRAEELADWVAAGCPRAEEWKRMWETHKRS